MKGEILREDLLAVLKEAGRVVNEDSYMAILHCVYLELCEGGRYRVLATNLEVGYKREMGGAHVEEPGTVAVGYRTLVDWLEAVSGDLVALVLKEHTVKTTSAITGLEHDVVTPVNLRLKCGRDEATMKEVFPAEDWPIFPETPPVVATIEAEDLVAMIEGVAWAADHNDPGPKGGVALEVGLGLRLVATDQCAISFWEKPLIKLYSEGKVLIPAVALVKTRSLLSGIVQICFEEEGNTVSFICGDKEVTIQTMGVKYFDYERIIESARANSLSWRVETGALRRLVKAGSTFARADLHPYLSLKWQPGDPSSVEMEIKHGRGDLSGAMDGMDGDVGELVANLAISYLVKAIVTMCSDIIEIRLAAAGGGAVYFSEVGEDHEVVIMSMDLKKVV